MYRHSILRAPYRISSNEERFLRFSGRRHRIRRLRRSNGSQPDRQLVSPLQIHLKTTILDINSKLSCKPLRKWTCVRSKDRENTLLISNRSMNRQWIGCSSSNTNKGKQHIDSWNTFVLRNAPTAPFGQFNNPQKKRSPWYWLKIKAWRQDSTNWLKSTKGRKLWDSFPKENRLRCERKYKN